MLKHLTVPTEDAGGIEVQVADQPGDHADDSNMIREVPLQCTHKRSGKGAKTVPIQQVCLFSYCEWSGGHHVKLNWTAQEGIAVESYLTSDIRRP